MHNKDIKSWGSAVSLEKREQFEERAETILQLLKSRLSGAPQTGLGISKIQYNKDPRKKNSRRKLPLFGSYRMSLKNFDPKQETERLNCMEPHTSLTLSDYMGWALEQDSENEKTEQS